MSRKGRIDLEMLKELDKHNLTQTEYKVLINIIANVLTNDIRIISTQAEIAREKQIDKALVSNAFKKLALLDIIKQESRSRWKINPSFIYDGHSEIFKRLEKEYKAITFAKDKTLVKLSADYGIKLESGQTNSVLIKPLKLVISNNAETN